MKRFHVHNQVKDLAHSVEFYTTLFGVSPAVEKPDYAKWMLDDPAVNFAISTHGLGRGIDHVGIQFDADEDVAAFRERAARAGTAQYAEADVVCCYARSDKHWATDPDGVVWEGFYSMAEAVVYSGSEDAACCES